ncbi:MarR family winged helix-turn-helix transcriptional regulator [Kitasatospora sp. HPMI-4]|uniref:MarR family winged helix-turn-helix transcriptional regulator n=1 Tax=Kitasatospora sp. HPMI-4 TaxID=3448443 RepID=UPI003F1B58AE
MKQLDSPEPDLSLLALLMQRTRWFQEELVRRLAAAGVVPITPAHLTVLAHLWDRDAVSIAELARRAGVTRQTMHRAVRQLVDEGLLSTEAGSGFPRAALVRVTGDGARRREVAARILAELEDELAAHLGAESLAALREILSRPWPGSVQP